MGTIKTLLEINLNYLVIVLIVIFFTLEQILGNQFKFNKRLPHFFHNALLYLTLFSINFFWAGVIVFTIQWFNTNEIGLFYLIEIPFLAKLLLGVVFFDFSSYCFHRMAHKFNWVWRFHRVHHSDTSMDSSTFFRSHPFELMFWFGTSDMLASAIFGLDLMSNGLYFLILTPMLFFEHANFKYPKWLDTTIGIVITTPNLHKVHHDQDLYYTNSNYADLFILWDRIFGTFKYKSVEEIKLGLQEFDNPKKQTFWYLLKSPFISIKT